MLKHQPLWWDTNTNLTNPSDFGALTAEPLAQVDVTIVGGGFTGLVAACELARAGISTMVIDAGPLGHGASGRAFGNVPIGNSASISELSQKHGTDKGKQLWLEGSATAQGLKDYIDQWSLDCDYHKGGHIKLAMNQRHNQMLQQEYQTLRQLLPEQSFDLLLGKKLKDEIDTPTVHSGLLDEVTAAIDPMKLFTAIAKQYVGLDGVLVANTRVNQINKDNTGQFNIHHEAGHTRSREIVLATNGYTGDLLPWVRRRIFSVGSYMIATTPLTKTQLAHFSTRRRTYSTAYHFKNYMRLSADGRLIFGGRADLSIKRDIELVVDELQQSMIKMFGFLSTCNISHVWGGQLGFTFDKTPHIGVNKSIHYAMGYSGRGIPMSLHFGQQIATMITGQSNKSNNNQSAYLDIDFPGFILYRKKPWFLPMVSAYYRFKDRY